MMRLLVMGLMAGLVTSLILCLLVFGNPVNSAGPENKPEYASDHILVKFRSDFSSSAVQSFHTQQEASIIKEFNPLNVQVVSVPEGEVREKIEVYRNNPDVLFAEPDYVLTADKEPNDPGYSSQWGLAAVQAAQAWDIAPGNSNTLIAILDTGIDQDHEDLSSKIIGNINFSSAADYDDHFGHGTHVAGIAAAVTNNGTGVAGLGCNAGLLNVKVLDDTGSGLDSGVADGIIWAVDNGAKVINLSLGGDNYSSTLETAVNYAWGKGAVVVAAAGNTGTNSYRYPAYYANCLAVAASDQGDTLASFSTWGDWVDVAAPGVQIYSTFPNHPHEKGDLNYGNLSGTSMAAPFVSGLAALVWGTAYGVSNSSVVNRIESSADEVSGTGDYWQYGRINCLRTVQTGVPTVKTYAATNISTSAAVLNGDLIELGGETLINVSFQWGTESGGPYPNETEPLPVTAAGTFSSGLNGLSSGHDYYFRAKAAGSTTVYGVVQHFQTSGVQYVLTTDITGQGKVKLSPERDTYPAGTSVLLTADSNPGWTFSGWGGDLDSTENPVTITMDSDKTITAVFTKNDYTLTLVVDPGNSGSISLDPEQNTFHYGDRVILTASAKEGYSFSHWDGELNGNDSTVYFTIYGNTSITARFTPLQCILTVNIVGKGSITRSPDAASYSPGQSVQLTAVPAKGYTFTSWEGVDTRDGKTAAVILNDSRTVTARFKARSTGGGGGGGAPSGGGGSVSRAALVKLNGLSVTGMLAVNSSGTVTGGSRLATLDGKVILEIAPGTTLKDAKGAALTSISLAAGNALLVKPEAGALLMSYVFGPEGAVFSPALSLTVKYDASALPAGTSETDLYLAYLAGEKWVKVEGKVDPVSHILTAKIDHFSTYGILAGVPSKPEPAKFKVGELLVTPGEVLPGNPVTVKSVVSNIGGTAGECGLVLKVNGAAEDQRVVQLDKGAEREISFLIDEKESGEYLVDINGSTGKFRVAVLMTADSMNKTTSTLEPGAIAEVSEVKSPPVPVASPVVTSPVTTIAEQTESNIIPVSSTGTAGKTGTSISELVLGIMLSIMVLAILLTGMIVFFRHPHL